MLYPWACNSLFEETVIGTTHPHIELQKKGKKKKKRNHKITFTFEALGKALILQLKQD